MDVQLPSPAPSYSQPAYCTSAESYLSPPLTTASVASSIASLPLPSMLTQCGSSAASSGYGMAWSFNEYAPMYASAV
jgi:hypothetical protein